MSADTKYETTTIVDRSTAELVDSAIYTSGTATQPARWTFKIY